MNLLCAQALPGAEDLDISACLRQLDLLAEFCKREFRRYTYKPRLGFSEEYHRMAVTVTLLKRDVGVHYHVGQKQESISQCPGPRPDSREIFINGPLSPSRAGTCSSIPVLIASVARRLGYPIKIATNFFHIWARWDTPLERFNVEASNPMGMTTKTDEEYIRNAREKAASLGLAAQVDLDSPYYGRSLTAAEELALFLGGRLECLQHNGREDECVSLMAHVLQLCPDAPFQPQRFFFTLARILLARYRKKFPRLHISDPKRGEYLELSGWAEETLSPDERPAFGAIMGHYHERLGAIPKACSTLGTAYVLSGRHPAYAADLERLFRRHLLRGYGVKFVMPGSQREQHVRLRRLAAESEAAGKLLMARDALGEAFIHDLHDIEAYEAMRRTEKRPEYQAELRAAEAAKPACGANDRSVPDSARGGLWTRDGIVGASPLASSDSDRRNILIVTPERRKATCSWSEVGPNESKFAHRANSWDDPIHVHAMQVAAAVASPSRRTKPND